MILQVTIAWTKVCQIRQGDLACPWLPRLGTSGFGGRCSSSIMARQPTPPYSSISLTMALQFMSPKWRMTRHASPPVGFFKLRVHGFFHVFCDLEARGPGLFSCRSQQFPDTSSSRCIFQKSLSHKRDVGSCDGWKLHKVITHRIHVCFIYLHLDEFYGKCR